MENLDLPVEGAEQTIMPTEANEIQADENIETTGETAEEQAEETAGDDKPQDDKDELTKGAKKRIDKITREKYELKRKLDYLESKVAELSKKPEINYSREDFGDNEEAYLDYKLEKKLRDQQSEYQKRVAQQQLEQERMSQWDSKIKEFNDELPDYAEVVDTIDFDLSPDELGMIMESDVGPKIAYKLASDENVQNKFLSLRSEKARERYLLKLELQLESEPRVTKEKPAVSKAPAPVKKPATGNKGGNVNPVDMSMADYVKWRNSK